MKEIEAWDMLKGNGCEKKTLTNMLDEMGFSRDSYMVIKRNGPALKCGDTRDSSGRLVENEYASFGANHMHPNNKQLQNMGIYDDFGAIDKQMSDYSMQRNNGATVNGMTGRNNGVYAAMANGGDEFIITKDAEIIKQLESQLHFAPDQLGVPLSNGAIPLDYQKQQEWHKIDHVCKQVSLGRLRGTQEKPKTIKSSFRNEYGELTPEYKKFRENKLFNR